MAQSDRNYTVSIGNDGQSLKCIDAGTGLLHNTYRYNGMLVSGPIVTGDRCTIVVRRGSTNYGIVLRLPSFLLTSTFSA